MNSVKLETDFHKVDEKSWRELLEKVDYPVVFQSPEMLSLFEKTDFFTPVLITVSENDKVVGTLLAVNIQEAKGLKGRFSKRTLVYGGPVLHPDAENTKDIFALLLRGLIKKVKQKSIFIQFRNFRDMSTYQAIFEKNGFHFEERLNLLTPATSEEVYYAGMSSSKRRQIRKSLANGAVLIAPRNEKDVRDFYQILFDLYKTRVRKPLPPLSLFVNFYKMGETAAGMIRLVLFEGKIIGGILCPVSPERAVYEWYVCGMDHEYSSHGVYPSVLATWGAIDYAEKNNIPFFDFMGIGRPDRPYGVRDFKMKFGGELVNYGRYERINNKFLYTLAELGYNALVFLGKL